jgi:hypothetical protein
MVIFYEWIIYPGVAISILSGICWTIKNHTRYKSYWSIVFFMTLIFTLGSYLPGSTWVASLPGFSLMRVPRGSYLLAGWR